MRILLDTHALLWALLEPHKDPFDRMLVAQSLHESLTLLSKDEALHQFPIPVVWE